MTPVSTPFFKLQLPGTWSPVKTSDPTLWQYQTNSEQLSVTALQYRSQPNPEEVSSHFKDYLEARRKSEVNAARSPKLELSPVTMQPQGNAWTAHYSGFHPELNRRFLCFAIGNTKRIVAFYYEALDLSDADFEKRKGEVLGTMQVVD